MKGESNCTSLCLYVEFRTNFCREGLTADLVLLARNPIALSVSWIG